MNAQAAPKHATSPQTPPLPQAKPESIGLSPSRLQKLSDTFKREIDKGTLPGATVMVARKGQVGWFDAIGRQSPAETRTTITNTMRVVMRVSFQDGQVTLRVSCWTCWMNSVGLVLAMRCYPEGL